MAVHREANETSLDLYDQYSLPGFDAHVYMAMADAPSVFTLPPWGWRLLGPALVHALPLPSARGFSWVTHAFLTASGGLLFLFLRRLGSGPQAALLGVAAFAFAQPVEASVAYPFLAEPLTLVCVLALLWAVEAGCGAGPLALAATAGALSKEIVILLLPVIFFARRDRDGTPRALATTLAAAAPAALATFLVRYVWASARPAPLAADQEAVWLALWRLVDGAGQWLPAAALSGLTPLAMLGALRAPGRLLLRRYGYGLAVTWALPFAASVYTGEKSAPFFLDDIPRLLLYALPFVVALALVAWDAAFAHLEPPAVRLHYATGAALVTSLLALLLGAWPALALDRYRRADLSGPRDGRLVLAFCRESLAEARRLEQGRQVDYDPERRSFVPRKSYPELLGRMRWFLRDGWGPGAPYRVGPVVTRSASAALVLPCLRPEDLNATLSLQAPREMRVRVAVNGRVVGELVARPEPDRLRVLVPGGLLFRGDNELRLLAPEPGLRLLGLRVRAAR
ncbi:MAG TPA: hypothetical protein VFM88_12650 [Vicinamibacteria bacterium]|nr:hypothetical protein [Vicinamibacteria bacterium]